MTQILSSITQLAQSKLIRRRTDSPMSLRVNFAWTLGGNIIYSACQWGLIVVIAKLTAPEMVGRFTLGLAVTAPIILLTNLQLRSVQATDARNEYSLGEYLRLRVLTIVVALIMIIGLVAVSGYGQDTAWVIIFVGIAKCAESMSDVIYGAFQKRDRMDLISVSLVVRGVASLAVMVIVLLVTAQILLATIAFAITWIAVLMLYDVHNLRHLFPGQTLGPSRHMLLLGWHWNQLWRLARLALPLGIVMMLISLNVNLPRYFLEGSQGEKEVGYFAALSYLILAGNTIVFALGQSSVSRLSRYYVDNRIAFKHLLLKLIGLATILGLLGVIFVALFGKMMLSVLYRPDYAEYADVLMWLMLATAVGFISSLVGYALTSMRLFKPQLPMFMAAGTAVFAICVWLIPIYGMYAAAWALLASAIIQILIGGGVIFVVMRSNRKIASPNS